MRRVIVESPYGAPDQAGIERNLRYLRACLADCHRRGEAPIASHGLHTQPGVLDDRVPAEREQGINAGFAWRDFADATVVYTDLGESSGMRAGILDAQRVIVEDATFYARVAPASAKSLGHVVEFRSLGEAWDHVRLDGLHVYATSLWGAHR